MMQFIHKITINNEIHEIIFDDTNNSFSHTNLGIATVQLFDETSGLPVTVDKIALKEGKIRRI